MGSFRSRSLIIPVLISVVVHGCHRPFPVPDPRLGASSSSLYGELRSSEANEPLAGALVRLYDKAGTIARDSTSTDNTGRFLFASLSAGVYQIQVVRIAHRRLTRELELHRGVTDTLRLVMAFDTTGMISDCISPDGRSFGSQFCRK